MAGNFWQSSHYEQWIFEKNDLLRMRYEDLKIYTEEEYQKLMIFYANLIQQIALEQQGTPKTRMQVIATACVYFKRFYARRSFKDIDPLLLAPTCIFLASKVEEHGMMSTSKLTSAVGTALKKWPGIQQEASMRVGFIHEAEFILLEIMDCCLIVYHAYRPLTHLIQDMQKDTTIKDVAEIEANAWRICNDTMRGDYALLYPPHMIAIACIIVATIFLNREKDIKNFLAELSVDFEKVHEVVVDINKMYVIWKSFDEKEQLKQLLDKMPKPCATPSQPQSNQGQQQQPQQHQQQQQQHQPQQQQQQSTSFM